MRILDRYILKSVFLIFISCVFVFLFLYVIIDVLSHLEDILKTQANFMFLAEYYLANLPLMFVQVAPFACLLATLYTFGRLNHDNELIAMRSSGLSLFQISKTVIIFGILVSLFVFWLSDRILPSSLTVTQKLKNQIEQGIKKKRDKKEVITNLSVYGLKNRLFFVNKFYPGANLMEGITILEQDERQNLTRKIVASKGIYKNKLWRFYQCITYDFDKNGQNIGEPRYSEEEIMTISETPQDFLNQRQRPELMSISQIDEYIWRLSRSGATTVIRNLKLDLYQRYTAPFTSLVIIILGLPFSLIVKKRATALSSIGICILVGFLYYVMDAVSIALGRSGVLMPLVAASLSHILALVTGLYLIASLP